MKTTKPLDILDNLERTIKELELDNPEKGKDYFLDIIKTLDSAEGVILKFIEEDDDVDEKAVVAALKYIRRVRRKAKQTVHEAIKIERGK